MLSSSAMPSAQSQMLGVLWMACRIHYTRNEMYGADISAINVPALYTKAIAKIQLSATPVILLLVPSFLIGRMYGALLARLGIKVLISTDPGEAYKRYLAPKRLAHNRLAMVIADWSLEGPGGSTPQDLIHFVTRDKNDDSVCFVALCGTGVLVGNAIRGGAHLFFRKPLMLHLHNLQRLLMPRAMALPGFPVELLRQSANHSMVRQVLCKPTHVQRGGQLEVFDASHSQLQTPAPHYTVAAHGDLESEHLAMSLSNAAGVSQLVRRIVEEMELDELDTAPNSFVPSMISYLKAHDPKHADVRWHALMQSAVKALDAAKGEIRRLNQEVAQCRHQAEVCFEQHRDVATYDPEDYLLSGLSRRELTLRAVQLSVRCRELDELLSASERASSRFTGDSADLVRMMNALMSQREANLKVAALPLSKVAESRKGKIATTKRGRSCRLAEKLEESLLQREDRTPFEKGNVSQSGPVFRNPWPPMLRGVASTTYHSVKEIVDRLLVECREASEQLTSTNAGHTAATTRAAISNLDTRIQQHLLDADVTKMFDIAVPTVLPSPKNGSPKQRKVAALPAPTSSEDAASQSAKVAMESKLWLHRAMTLQSNSLEGAARLMLLRRRFTMWFAFVLGGRRAEASRLRPVLPTGVDEVDPASPLTSSRPSVVDSPRAAKVPRAPAAGSGSTKNANRRVSKTASSKASEPTSTPSSSSSPSNAVGGNVMDGAIPSALRV